MTYAGMESLIEKTSPLYKRDSRQIVSNTDVQPNKGQKIVIFSFKQ